jgi:hypothetical protein
MIKKLKKLRKDLTLLALKMNSNHALPADYRKIDSEHISKLVLLIDGLDNIISEAEETMACFTGMR